MSALLVLLLLSADPVVPVETPACARYVADDHASGLPEGPLQIGYSDSDMTVGRRACPRSEVALGGQFGAIIDTPDFYGTLGVHGRVSGSWALRHSTELYASLDAINYTFAQNAVLTSTQLAFGSLTIGATQVLHETDRLALSVTGRVLLPTSFEIPNARLLGGEHGGMLTWHALRWLEVHGFVGGDMTGTIGSRASGLPRGGLSLLGGVQLQPFRWGALVVDLNGRVGPVTYFAPSVGLRFGISRFGIEVGGSVPLVGTDRHDFIAAARLSWRFD